MPVFGCFGYGGCVYLSVSLILYDAMQNPKEKKIKEK